LIFLIPFILWYSKYRLVWRGRRLAKELKEELSYNLDRLNDLKKQLTDKQKPWTYLKDSVYITADAQALSTVFSIFMFKYLSELYDEFKAVNMAFRGAEEKQEEESTLISEEQIDTLQKKILGFQKLINATLKIERD
jgi:hypothetical protein